MKHRRLSSLDIIFLICLDYLLLQACNTQIIIKRNESKQIWSCSLPQQPLNGRFRIRRQGGITAIFSCNEGYSISGSSSASCLEDLRTWSNPPPSCIPNTKITTACDEIVLSPQAVELGDDPLTLNCPRRHLGENSIWLKDSTILSYLVPGITLLQNDSLSLSSVDLVGSYICLTTSPTAMRVAASYLVTRGKIQRERESRANLVPTVILHDSAPATNEYCGVASIQMEAKSRQKRIIDGTRAEKGSAPWMGILATEKNAFVCGCSLLNSKWVITAAHCLNSIEEGERESLNIKLGKYIRRHREPGQFVSQVNKIVLHHDFRPRLVRNGKIIVNANDIALLRLESPAPISTTGTSPICLPKPGLLATLPSSTLAIVTGWGRVSVQQSINAYTLQEAKLPLVDKLTCEASSDYALAEGTLCAGYAESYKPDTCDGDSGGPLIVHHENRFYLLGIVSWGQGCSSPGKYGIYTDVEKYLNWINNVLQQG